MPPNLPVALLQFIDRFNRKAYWESHELLEGSWRASRSPFYKGLILYASAYVHVQRGNPRGITAQFRKAERELTKYRPAYLGIDVDALLTNADYCRHLVEVNAHAPPAHWMNVIPYIRLKPEPSLVRGDEPELNQP
jgi:predicted metal-dependent hydrolase